jgi:molybdopterin synthase sulfur carrier subunit
VNLLHFYGLRNYGLRKSEAGSFIISGMPSVRFTRNIQRHVECPTREVPGATLHDVLDAYFATNERARGYVLEDDGRLRKHMAVFIDGEQIGDRDRLSDAVPAGAVIDVVQSLSGG